MKTNISLKGSVDFHIYGYRIDTYDCSKVEAYWKIQRTDGIIEVFNVLNNTYQDILLDRGLEWWTDCYSLCEMHLYAMPTDLRYNGAQITGVFYLPECYNSPNVTDTITLNIQGI